MSELFQTLLDVKDAPLYIVMAGSDISDNRMSLNIDLLFYAPLSAPNADYEIVGSIKKAQPISKSYYNINESELYLEFTVEGLIKKHKNGGVREWQKDFDKPITYYLRAKKQ